MHVIRIDCLRMFKNNGTMKNSTNWGYVFYYF